MDQDRNDKLRYRQAPSKKGVRPWDILRSPSQNYDFEESSSDSSSELNSDLSASSPNIKNLKLIHVFKERSVSLVVSFLLSAMVMLTMAWFIPSSYYSTLHVFAPEFSDTIGTRLSLFTQRIEYASFPVDSKTPVSVISRRLREDTAKEWVLNKIKSDPTLSQKMSGLNEASVSVETYYVPNQQILQIDGFANTPEHAVEISYLYQMYLLDLIKSIETEQAEKVRRWFELTNKSIDEQMSALVQELRGLAPKTMDRPSVNLLREQIGSNYTNKEIKRNSLTRALNDLIKLKSMTNFQGYTESVDSEVHAKLLIYNQLLDRKELFGESRVEQARLDILQTIERRIRATEQLLRESTGEIDFTKDQMAYVGSKESNVRVYSEQENDLRFLLTNLRMVKIDLAKLKSQVDMETSIRSSSFKVIREPIPNYDSLRPNPFVKYGLALFVAALFSVCVVLFLSLLSKRRPLPPSLS